MPRIVEFCVPPAKADEILARIESIDGVLGYARQRDASLRPAGDIITIRTTNDASRPVMQLLGDLGMRDDGYIQTSAPRSLIVSEQQGKIDHESNETTWDEIAFLLRLETNLSQNFLATMFLAGAVCAVGLWSDTLHLIIASMVIASAFEPMVRMSFGMVAGPRSLIKTGLLSTVVGYAVLALGGGLTLLVLQAVEPGSELESLRWIQYWTQIPVTGVITAILAGAAGTVIVLGQRSVLTTGVMIALALVPSMSIAGMAIGSGEVQLAAEALARWGVDAGIVVVVSAIVLAVKRKLLHHERAMG